MTATWHSSANALGGDAPDFDDDQYYEARLLTVGAPERSQYKIKRFNRTTKAEEEVYPDQARLTFAVQVGENHTEIEVRDWITLPSLIDDERPELGYAPFGKKSKGWTVAAALWGREPAHGEPIDPDTLRRHPYVRVFLTKRENGWPKVDGYKPSRQHPPPAVPVASAVPATAPPPADDDLPF